MENGNYYARFVEATTGEARNEKRTPYIALVFEITHRAVGQNWEPFAAEYPAKINWWLTDGAWPYTSKKLQAVGFNGDFTNPDVSMEFKSDGHALTCTMNANGYPEYDLPEVASGGEPQPLTTDTARKLTARYRTDAAASKVPGGAPKAPPAAPAPTAPVDLSPEPPALDENGNEIPF